MSQYTTGQLARICGITVRTVQYYDARGILAPSALSEGGRRLYTDDDLHRLRIICFLRELGLSIDGIHRLLQEDAPRSVIDTLLRQQRCALESQIADRQAMLRRVSTLQEELKDLPQFSVEAIGDIATIMQSRKKRRRMLCKMLIAGIVMDALQISGIVYGVKTGCWWPLAAAFALVVALGVAISYLYYAKTAYICPRCHNVFRTSFRACFFARHTPRLRRLDCPRCGRRGFCVEIYQEEPTHA